MKMFENSLVDAKKEGEEKGNTQEGRSVTKKEKINDRNREVGREKEMSINSAKLSIL